MPGVVLDLRDRFSISMKNTCTKNYYDNKGHKQIHDC